MDEQFVRARVAGRHAANELSDLYIAESARLVKEHGVEASIAFLEQLRDNLVAIRPFPVPDPVPAPSADPSVPARDGVRAWDEDDLPNEFTLVVFDDYLRVETAEALNIGGKWLPKSVVMECDELENGDPVDEWPVKKWFARKEGLV